MRARVGKISKEELQKIVSESDSFSEVIHNLGYYSKSGSNHKTVKRWLNKYGIKYDHFTSNTKPRKLTFELVFRQNSDCTQKVLRHWYKNINYIKYKCSICGQEPFWNGNKLTLILDHKNGINNDNRIDNLRWVCPNCNQQLPTTGFHGNKYKRG